MAHINYIKLVWIPHALKVFADQSFIGLQMAKLEGVIQTLEREREEEKDRAKEREQEYAKVERQSACGPECVRVREELENTHSSMQQIQVLAPFCSTHTSI